MKLNDNHKKYIYNYKQADFFMKIGAKCIGTGFNAKSDRYFWEFNYNQLQEYYPLSEISKNKSL